MVRKGEKRPQVSKKINSFFAVARGKKFGAQFERARPILTSLDLPGQAMRSVAKMIYDAQEMNLEDNPNVIVAGVICALGTKKGKRFDYSKIAKAMGANVSGVRKVADIFAKPVSKKQKMADITPARQAAPHAANQDMEKLASILRIEIADAIGQDREGLIDKLRSEFTDKLKGIVEERLRGLQAGISKRGDNNGTSERLVELDAIAQTADADVLRMLGNDNWWPHIRNAAEVLKETAFQRDAQRNMLRMIYVYGFDRGPGVRNVAGICMACAYLAALDYGFSLNFEKALRIAKITEPRIKIVATQLTLHDMSKLPSMRILEGLGLAENGKLKSGYLKIEQEKTASTGTATQSKTTA